MSTRAMQAQKPGKPSQLGLYFTPMNYNKYLYVGVTVSFFMVVASTVLGAYMVEAAQSSSGSRLTSR